MEHVLRDLARARQRDMLACAESDRDGRKAWRHNRISRQAERAERQLASQWDQAVRLRADLSRLESAG